MSNDIKGLGMGQPPVTESRHQPRPTPVAGARAHGTAGPRSGPAGDRVEIGSQTLVAEARRRIDETPAVDRSRVEALRTAIAEGRYEVRPERIAERLLAMERLLGRGGR